jgi:(2Fe-2S) ferredoxin
MAEQLYFRTHVFCCNNVRPPGHKRGCCSEKGSDKLRDYMKVRVKELGLGEMRVNSAGCLDRCDLGPVMVVYPEGVWYNYRTREDVDEIVESHLKGGKPVERLRLPARE